MLAGIILCGSGLVIHRPGYAQLSGGLIQTAQTCLPTGFNGPFRALRFAQNRQKNSVNQRKGPDWPFAMYSVRHGQPVRLFTDTEAGEDTSKQFVGTESTGYFTERLLSDAQIFGQQFTCAHQG